MTITLRATPRGWQARPCRHVTADPHTAIVGANTGVIRNLVDARARPAQKALLTIVKDAPDRTLAAVRRLEDS